MYTLTIEETGLVTGALVMSRDRGADELHRRIVRSSRCIVLLNFEDVLRAVTDGHITLTAEDLGLTDREDAEGGGVS